eukprot:2250589-Prymnesium_polylepis.1
MARMGSSRSSLMAPASASKSIGTVAGGRSAMTALRTMTAHWRSRSLGWEPQRLPSAQILHADDADGVRDGQQVELLDRAGAPRGRQKDGG